MSAIKALTLDILGTVVDWRTTIIREGKALEQVRGIRVDWSQFADAWRAGYRPTLERVQRGELPWMSLDDVHRMILEELLEKFGIMELNEVEKDELNRVWHRLDPWPDAVEGIRRLRKRFIVAALSNGHLALLINLSRHVGLIWDCILSAELAKQYKPHPKVYETAASLLGLDPEQIVMVAAHPSDLKGAQAVGFKAAMVRRPLELGPQTTSESSSNFIFDWIADDLHDLADQLGVH